MIKTYFFLKKLLIRRSAEIGVTQESETQIGCFTPTNINPYFFIYSCLKVQYYFHKFTILYVAFYGSSIKSLVDGVMVEVR